MKTRVLQSPEGTPAGPTLRNIQMRSSLFNKFIHLIFNSKLLIVELTPFQLLLNPLQSLNSLLIYLLLVIHFVRIPSR